MEFSRQEYWRCCSTPLLFNSSGCCAVYKPCLTLCDAMNFNMPGCTVFHYFPEFAQTQVHWVSSTIHYLILCHPLFILPAIFPSIRVFFNELTLHIRWLNCWSFIFSISPSNEYSGLISFRIDWCYLLAVQGTIKSLLQYHIWKVSILPLSLLYGPTLTSIHDYRKTTALIKLPLLEKWCLCFLICCVEMS